MKRMDPSPAAMSTLPHEQLRQFAEEISGELQLEPLLARVTEIACVLTGAADGTVELRDWRRAASCSGTPDRQCAADPAAARLLGRLATTLMTSGDSAHAPQARIAGINLPGAEDREVIALGIQWKGELTGCLAVTSAARGRLAEGAVQTLEVFARHAGIAIENARRYARARRRTTRFELVARVAQIINAGVDVKSMLQQTADAIHEILEFPNVDVPLLDPADPEVLVVEVRGGGYKQRIQHVDRLPISQGVMGAAVRERRTQRIDNVVADPRYITPPSTLGEHAELAVPIMVSGRVLGVLNVEGESPYDELDQRTLEIIADHLGIAIQNARLHALNRDAAVWQERARLRHELHDSVTQILSSISLLAQALPSAWRRSPDEGERRAERLAELAQTAFAEMRALLRELQPPEEAGPNISRKSRSFLGLERLRDGGLGAALPRLLDAMIPESIARSYQFQAYLPQHLAHEEALYRVCQEAVSNVIRHASARHVRVCAQIEHAAAWLSVFDDGVGLPPDLQGGIGLKSMRERITRLGGTLTLQPVNPRGLEIRALLPRRDRDLEPSWTNHPCA